jgi:hypothetical protein
MTGLVVHAGPSLAAPQEQRVVYVIERTTPGPSSYKVMATAQPGEGGAFVGSVFAAVARGRITGVRPGSSTSMDRTNEPHVYSPAATVSSCDVGQCDLYNSTGGQGISYEDTDGSDPLNRAFIAVAGIAPRVEFEGDGWRLRRTSWTFAFVDGTESDGVGVRGGDTHGAELFLEAALGGGRYGSIALATPPCSTTTTNAASRGIGRVTLDGGVEPQTVTCPTDNPSRLASWAPGAATWSLSGPAAGTTELSETRLFVLDFPRGYLARSK